MLAHINGSSDSESRKTVILTLSLIEVPRRRGQLAQVAAGAVRAEVRLSVLVHVGGASERSWGRPAMLGNLRGIESEPTAAGC